MTNTILVQPPGKAGQATLIVASGDPATLIQNPGPNTVFLGDNAGIQPSDALGIVPLNPNGYLNVDGSADLYATVAIGQTQTLNVITGGTNFFSPPSLSGLGGVKIFVQALAPTQPPIIPVNSLWFNTTLNALEVWNGAAWVVQAFAGNELIQAGTIVANLVAAGTVIGGIVDGTTVKAATFIGGNYFGYSGSVPAQDTLIISMVPGTASVDDGAGNTALAGVTVYGGVTTQWQAFGLVGTGLGFGFGLAWYSSTNAHMTAWAQQGEFSPGFTIQTNITNSGQGFSFGSGVAREQVEINGSIGFVGAPSPGAFPGAVVLFSDPTTFALTRILPSTFTDRISGAQGDHTRFTVVGTGSNQLTKAWDIPPGDSQNDTHYRLIAWGKGTWGSTLQQLSANVSGGHAGTNTPTAQQTISTNFFWKAIMDLHIEVASGVGSATWNLEFNTSEGGTHGYSAHGNTEAGAWNSTADNTVALFAGWAATTGAPTVTCDGSTFERLGR